MCRLLFRAATTENHDLVEKALDNMKRGGPDNQEYISLRTSIGSYVVLGHNRLSIIDLSEEANQPMQNDRVYILFNGEIYNYKELREKYKLECKTQGDTEVILELFLKLGPKAFSELDGEYAIVIYDHKTGDIYATRDPMGIKPLYWTNDNQLIFSSEVKGILPFIETDYTKQQLENILTYGYPINGTIFEGIEMVPPGDVFKFNRAGYKLLEHTTHNTKSISEVFKKRSYFPKEITREQRLSTAIENAVVKRMIADVPISVTLSGGVDSAIITGLMAKHSSKPVKTYTIGFKNLGNEFDQARKVAKYFGTDHTEVEIDPEDILHHIDDILYALEDPMDRGSSMYTYFLGRSIKEKVTLIGEGADELFGGYNRHKEVLPEDIEEYKTDFLKVFTDRTDNLQGEFMYDYEDMNSVLAIDLMNEIPNYHTMRIDKLMMAHGIEARVPYLDPEVVKVAMDISTRHKIDPKKKILRNAFKGTFPDWMLNPEKKALKLPYEIFVKRKEVKDTILKNPIFFSKDDIQDLYRRGEDPPRNWGRKLWQIYLLIKWYELFIRK